MEKNIWTKSASCGNTVNCVGVLDTGSWIYVKSSTYSTLRFSYREWEEFLAAVRTGKFDIQ